MRTNMAEECANPLLLGWLKEWMDEAQSRNSKGYTVFVKRDRLVPQGLTIEYRYKKAYQSMKACPLKFDHPAEAQQLSGLGPKLCDRLADKLKKYCNDNGLPMPEKQGPRSKRKSSDNVTDIQEGQPQRKPKKQTLYVPKLRSGAYALIMALSQLDEDNTQGLSKSDLIETAQPYCDSSFTAPTDPTKFYTAWKSMQTLETKELIYTRGHPTKRYFLSDEGWDVAHRMKAAENAVGSSKRGQKQKSTVEAQSNSRPSKDKNRNEFELDIDDLDSGPEGQDGASPSRSLPKRIAIGDSRTANGTSITEPHADVTEAQPIILKPGTFEVQMILDTREVRTKTDRDYLANELKKQSVNAEIRALPLGDVLWIAKLKPPHDLGFKARNSGDDDEGSTEIVLEHAVERKRLDDLIGSIKDGRFHEQKFRLKKSGIRNITYLIEDYAISTEKGDKYGDAVESSIASMQVVNDIFVKRTSKIDETIRYLARMTKTLKELYEKRELHVIPSRTLDVSTYLSSLEEMRRIHPEIPFCVTFSAFCSLCDKSDSMTLRDVYLKMLMCTRGITGDKAIEIQKIWNTPQTLIEAYEKVKDDPKKRDSLISDKLADRIPRKRVAKALSAKVAEVWSG